MIRYTLRCENGHDFDGWFRSSDGFETLRTARQITCPDCGSVQVAKSLMTPSVPSERVRKDELRQSQQVALRQLRQQVEKNSDYVGVRFVDEARAMHDGEKPNRAIHGEAKLEDARKLLEDGIPVAPLPFIPRQKTN